MKEPIVVNALLRCTRHDQKASPLFKRTRDDLNLWVWELDGSPPLNTPWSQAVSALCQHLRKHLPFLKELFEGSDSYTLFVQIAADPHQPTFLPPFQIPLELVRLTLQIGCTIELYFDNNA